MKSKRFAEAEDMFRRSLEIRERLSVQNPEVYEPLVADSYYNIGEVHMNAGKMREAEDALQTALGLFGKYEATSQHCAANVEEIRKHLENIRVSREPDKRSNLSNLTPEEREIALLLTDGVTQRDIARKLKLTAADVSRRVSAIRDKVAGVGSTDPRIAAIAYAYKLSSREANILSCLSRGMPNADIASELFITEETVRVHTHRLIKKLPVENRQDVAAWVGAYRDITE